MRNRDRFACFGMFAGNCLAVFVLTAAVTFVVADGNARVAEHNAKIKQDCEGPWPNDTSGWVDTAPVTSKVVPLTDPGDGSWVSSTTNVSAPQCPGDGALHLNFQDSPLVAMSQAHGGGFMIYGDESESDTWTIRMTWERSGPVLATVHKTDECKGHNGFVSAVACTLDDDMPMLFGCGGTGR